MTNDLKRWNVVFQSMSGLVPKAVRLRWDLAEVWKEIKICGAKLVSPIGVGNEIAAINIDVEYSVMSVAKARENRFFMNALTRKRKLEIVLSEDTEKTLGRNLTSVK